MYFTAGRTQTTAGMERRLLDYYELGDVIGEGGFGSVCAGTCRQNGDTVREWHMYHMYCMQVYACVPSSEASFALLLYICYFLHHPHLLSIYIAGCYQNYSEV